MRYRLIYIVLGALAVAVVVTAVVFAPSGEPTELPAAIDSVSPGPNDAALRQAILEVDLKPGYRAEIWVDGFRIPDSEVVYIEATGVHRWQPSPTSLYMSEWTPGEHEVRIAWNTISGPPDVGEFTWTFRIQ